MQRGMAMAARMSGAARCGAGRGPTEGMAAAARRSGAAARPTTDERRVGRYFLERDGEDVKSK